MIFVIREYKPESKKRLKAIYKILGESSRDVLTYFSAVRLIRQAVEKFRSHKRSAAESIGFPQLPHIF
jgi:hypothetical protein